MACGMMQGASSRRRNNGGGIMKTVQMSYAAWTKYAPMHHDRAAYKSKGWDMVVATWSTRLAMLKALDSERRTDDRNGVPAHARHPWQPYVPEGGI